MDTFLSILAVVFVTQITAWIVNYTKNSFYNTFLYKLSMYFIIFTLNTLTFTILSLVQLINVQNNLIIVYIFITIASLFIDFILDEDSVFRFDKKLAFIFSTVFIMMMYSFYYFLLF